MCHFLCFSTNKILILCSFIFFFWSNQSNLEKMTHNQNYYSQQKFVKFQPYNACYNCIYKHHRVVIGGQGMKWMIQSCAKFQVNSYICHCDRTKYGELSVCPSYLCGTSFKSCSQPRSHGPQKQQLYTTLGTSIKTTKQAQHKLRTFLK